MTYEIPEVNLPNLEKRLKSISRKCEKTGMPFSYEVKGESFRTYFDEFRKKHIIRCVTVDVSGIAKINGWRFSAKLEPMNGKNLIFTMPDSPEIPVKYRDAMCQCEHCKTNRGRKVSFLVSDDQGKFLQLGRQCLKLYTGGIDAQCAADYAEIIKEMDDMSGGIYDETSIGGNYYPVLELVASAAESVRLNGYISASSEECLGGLAVSTSRMAFIHTECGKPMNRMEETQLTKDNDRGFNPDVEIAQKMIDWVESENPDSSYLLNLQAVCKSEYISKKYLNLLCSLPVAYEREMKRREREKKISECTSVCVGNVGDKLTGNVKDWKILTSWGNDYGGNVWLCQWTDENGNVFIWKASNPPRECPDGKTVKGTIKEHRVYKGINQTVMTRCKFS